jgi:CheY-like chemotaxis protein
MSSLNPLTILVADDDRAACRLTKEALHESGLTHDVRFVHDGEVLLDYLSRRGGYGAPGTAPRPYVILLDLNMPRMDGWEALTRIKANPELRRIPVVVLSSSRSDEDIHRSYDLGADSFISKLMTFTGLVEVPAALARYWFEIVQLPPAKCEPA